MLTLWSVTSYKWAAPIYNSSDFNQFRVQLRKKELDFAPISEFGIGFLSTFLLADHVEVETAMWESLRGDTAKRTLKIDGPTRLIRLDEQRNDGAGRFKGTRITLFLSPKIPRGDKLILATWEECKQFLKQVCQDLPYSLNLEYVFNGQETKEQIEPLPLIVEVPPKFEFAALRIPVNDIKLGLEGEVVLMNEYAMRNMKKSLAGEGGLVVLQQSEGGGHTAEGTRIANNALLRGGFRIGEVPSIPDMHDTVYPSGARIRLTWASGANRRYATPNLARNSMSHDKRVEHNVFRAWFNYLVQHIDELPVGQLWAVDTSVSLEECFWLEEYDAYTMYQIGRNAWLAQLYTKGIDEKALETWESGQGMTLRWDFYGIGRELLDLVLPKVTRRFLQTDYVDYLFPPAVGWQSTLKGWHDYISSPVEWGHFGDYAEEIEDFIMYSEYGFSERLNSKYKDRFSSWNAQDIALVRQIIGGVCYRLHVEDLFRSHLDMTHVAIFQRLVEVAGDLKVGSGEKSWILSDITLAQL